MIDSGFSADICPLFQQLDRWMERPVTLSFCYQHIRGWNEVMLRSYPGLKSSYL